MALTVYFDLDGPILDVSRRYYQLHCDLAAALRIPPLAFATYWELKRNQASLEVILPESSPEERARYQEQRQALIETREYLQYDQVYPWAPAVLDSLHRSYRLGLVTLRNSRELLLWQLGRLQLADFFDVVLSRDRNQGDWQAKRDLLVSDRCFTLDSLIVGDTEGDILAGQSLGLLTVGVTCGIRTEARVAALAPTRIIPDIRPLASIVAEHLSP